MTDQTSKKDRTSEPRTWQEQEEEEAAGDRRREEAPDGLKPRDPVDRVEAPELEVGEEVADEHGALQHRVEEAAVSGHGVLVRVVGQESALRTERCNVTVSLPREEFSSPMLATGDLPRFRSPRP